MAVREEIQFKKQIEQSLRSNAGKYHIAVDQVQVSVKRLELTEKEMASIQTLKAFESSQHK